MEVSGEWAGSGDFRKVIEYIEIKNVKTSSYISNKLKLNLFQCRSN
jgi:hypothetical protein